MVRHGARHGLGDESVDWLRIVPFAALHAGCLAVWWVGWSGVALGVALASYAVRAFAISAFFHRGFAHRAFRTGRVVQFVFAFIGTAATQRGPLWWVAHHRNHHAHADTGRDPHDSTRGFWWSHMGWFLGRRPSTPASSACPTSPAFPELRWLNRYDLVPPLACAVRDVRPRRVAAAGLSRDRRLADAGVGLRRRHRGPDARDVPGQLPWATATAGGRTRPGT